MIMMGKDWAAIKIMYDRTLLNYDRLLKVLNEKDFKIKANKKKLGIQMPLSKEESRLLSLMNQTK